MATYAAHINRENREQRIAADTDRRGLARIDKAVAGIMAAIEDGMYQPAMKARMAELEREWVEIAARLVEAPHSVPHVHPGIAEIYKRKVARLNETLKGPGTRLDASSDIRSLIGILDFASDTQQPAERRVRMSVSPAFTGMTKFKGYLFGARA